MIKIDTDSYVDMDGYSKWLNVYFDPLDSHYLGQMMLCGNPRKMFIHGTWTLSKGIFLDNQQIDFYAGHFTINDHCDADDAWLGAYLWRYLKIRMTDIGNNINTKHILGFAQENSLKLKWELLKTKNKTECIWICHKCTGNFRLEFADQSKKNRNIKCNKSPYDEYTQQLYPY